MPKAAQLLSGPADVLTCSSLSLCSYLPTMSTVLSNPQAFLRGPLPLTPCSSRLQQLTSRGHSLTMTLTLSQPFPSLLSETPALALSMRWCLA